MSFDQARITDVPQDVMALRRSMLGASDRRCDTPRHGRVFQRVQPPGGSPPAYGGDFDEVVDRLAATLYDGGILFEEAVERAVVFRGQLTLHVIRRYLVVVAGVQRDDPRLRFELCLDVSGVHYPADVGRELHSVYLLMSITHNWRVHLEVAVPQADPHVPSLFSVCPAVEWHEREVYELFGIVFDKHPSPTRIETPGDWRGHPRRRGYLSGQDPGAIPSLRDSRAPGPDGIRLVTERTLMPGEQGGRSDRALTDGDTDWGQIATTATRRNHERRMVSADTQRRSAQVMALIVETDGKTVTHARCGIEYLHSAIEKSLEHDSRTQCLTFVSRMDNLSLFNEAAYGLGVERLLGITEAIPERANVIRVLLMELNRVFSHLLALTTGGMELGALNANPFGLRERELTVSAFKTITSLRMNHDAYIRPGGLARDLPGEAIPQIRDLLKLLPKRLADMENRLKQDSPWKARTQGIGYLDLSKCIALGVMGPLLRSAGLPHDLRRAQPYCSCETYEFEVITDTAGDAYSRYLIRVKEIKESLRIVEQCLDQLAPGPITADDPKLAWLTQLALGPDDFGDSRKHLARIMGTSMKALIHVNEAVRVPAGQVYVAVESPCGELGVHIVSDGGSQPYRVHYRDPSFTNLQAFSTICEGATIADGADDQPGRIFVPLGAGRRRCALRSGYPHPIAGDGPVRPGPRSPASSRSKVSRRRTRSAVAAYAYVRLIMLMFFTTPDEDSLRFAAPGALTAPAIAAGAAVTILFSNVPQPLLDVADHAGQFLR